MLSFAHYHFNTFHQAYAQAAFDVHQADAVTLSPYMGWDSIKPFVTGSYSHKGVFILCKTSNPSSRVSLAVASILPHC